MGLAFLPAVDGEMEGIISTFKNKVKVEHIKRAVEGSPRRPWPKIPESIQIWLLYSRAVSKFTSHPSLHGYSILLRKQRPNNKQSCSSVYMMYMFAFGLDQAPAGPVTQKPHPHLATSRHAATSHLHTLLQGPTYLSLHLSMSLCVCVDTGVLFNCSPTLFTGKGCLSH